MSLNITDPFVVDSKVEIKGDSSVYSVRSKISYRCGYVYLLQLEGTHNSCIATHEQLGPHYNIEVGDAVIVSNQRYVVTSISTDKLFAGLLGVSGVVSMSKMELVPRALAIEFDNAVRNIYGPGSNMLETEDGIKMGDIEMKYGKIICDEIMRVRKTFNR